MPKSIEVIDQLRDLEAEGEALQELLADYVKNNPGLELLNARIATNKKMQEKVKASVSIRPASEPQS